MSNKQTFINPNLQLNKSIINSGFSVDVTFLKSMGKSYFFEAGEAILKEGEICDAFYFVEKGILRTYRWHQDKEITICFAFPGDIDTCPYSLMHNKKSPEIIEALTFSHVIVVKKKVIEENIPGKLVLYQFFSEFFSAHIEIIFNRTVEFKAQTAEQNYLNLLKQQPDQINKIPLMYIASYLGISKERLSRIRKKQLT